MMALLNDVRGLDWLDVYATTDVNDLISFIFFNFDNHVGLRRLRPRNQINPSFNMTIQKAICERDICHAVWRALRTNEDRYRFRRMREEVTRLVRAAKRSYITHFLNHELAMTKILRTVGAAENPLDTGPVIFSPDELSCCYSSDIMTNQPVYTPLYSPQSEGVNFQTVSISTTKPAIRGIRSNAVQARP
jgi:hypothetical protein